MNRRMQQPRQKKETKYVIRRNFRAVESPPLYLVSLNGGKETNKETQMDKNIKSI